MKIRLQAVFTGLFRLGIQANRRSAGSFPLLASQCGKPANRYPVNPALSPFVSYILCRT